MGMMSQHSLKKSHNIMDYFGINGLFYSVMEIVQTQLNVT